MKTLFIIKQTNKLEIEYDELNKQYEQLNLEKYELSFQVKDMMKEDEQLSLTISSHQEGIRKKEDQYSKMLPFFENSQNDLNILKSDEEEIKKQIHYFENEKLALLKRRDDDSFNMNQYPILGSRYNALHMMPFHHWKHMRDFSFFP